MNGKIISFLVLWVLSLGLCAGAAQTSYYRALSVTVPFDFVVGNQTFPAGTYKFRSLLNSVPGRDTIDVLEVRSTEGHSYKAIVTDVVGREDTDNPSLVFTHNGGRAFLSEVREPEKQSGCRLRSSADPTEIANDWDEQITLTSTD